MALAEGTYNNSDLTQAQIDELLAEDYKGAGYSNRYIDINPVALNSSKFSDTSFTSPAPGYLVVLAEMDDHYTDRILMTIWKGLNYQIQIYSSACGDKYQCSLILPYPGNIQSITTLKFFKTGIMSGKIKYFRFIYSIDAAEKTK